MNNEQSLVHLTASEFNFIQLYQIIKHSSTSTVSNKYRDFKILSSKVKHMQKKKSFHTMYSLKKYNIVKIMDCLTWIPPPLWNVSWVSLYTVCTLSYCCGKQVVFFSHSRRLLKQRAFSINLSISAATPLTAGWRAGSEVGKVQYKHTHMHRMWVVAWRAQWEVTHVPFYVNEFCIRGYRWKERQSSSVGKETLMRWMEHSQCSLKEDLWFVLMYIGDTGVGFAAQLIPYILDNTDNWPYPSASRQLYLTERYCTLK